MLLSADRFTHTTQGLHGAFKCTSLAFLSVKVVDISDEGLQSFGQFPVLFVATTFRSIGQTSAVFLGIKPGVLKETSGHFQPCLRHSDRVVFKPKHDV